MVAFSVTCLRVRRSRIINQTPLRAQSAFQWPGNTHATTCDGDARTCALLPIPRTCALPRTVSLKEANACGENSRYEATYAPGGLTLVYQGNQYCAKNSGFAIYIRTKI